MTATATTTTATTFICIDDRYDRDGSIAYDSAADFIEMCLAAFGEAPRLHETAQGWADQDGALVLKAAPASE